MALLGNIAVILCIDINVNTKELSYMFALSPTGK